MPPKLGTGADDVETAENIAAFDAAGSTRHSLPRVAIEAAELVAALATEEAGRTFCGCEADERHALASPDKRTVQTGPDGRGRCGRGEELHSPGSRRRYDGIEAHRCARKTICTR